MSAWLDDPLCLALQPAVAAFGLFMALRAFASPQNPFWRGLMVAIGVALALRYLAWRVFDSLPSADWTADFLFGALFLAIEGVAALGGVMSMIFLSRTLDRSPEADAQAGWFLALPRPPKIAVLIATYNEEAAILERTIIGALAQDYPRFEVHLLDDGRRPDIAALCATLGCSCLTRADNAHAKAGNINAALKKLAASDPPPDFVAILDADFVPTPRFLSRAMALHRAGDVGVVQTPQHFINPDPIQQNLSLAQIMPDEQRFFFDVVLASKDAWGAAFCCGTSSIIRFAPLVAMGGFPTDSVTEDFLLTLRLKERGFKTVYLNEPLSLGLAPEGLKDYLTQRGRWCLGFMQIMRGRSSPLRRGNGLSALDRVVLIENFLSWSFGYAVRLVGIAAPLAYFAFGLKIVAASVEETLSFFMPFFVWQLALTPWISAGRATPILTDAAQLVATPTLLKAAAIGLFGARDQKFKVTAKGGDRSRRFIEWSSLKIFLALILALLIGIFAFFGPANPHVDGYSGLSLFWSWYNLLVLAVAGFICVERPRYRGAVRYACNEPVALRGPAGDFATRLIDISITGAQAQGAAPAALGAEVEASFGAVTVKARIARIGAHEFALDFAPAPASRLALTRHFYAAGYYHGVGVVDQKAVARGLLRRIFA